MRRFNLSESEIWPGCLEIEVAGELDLAVTDRLEAALAGAAAAHHHVLLDLEACDFIDASGLGVLIRADRKLRDRGCQLLLYGVRGQVRRMLALTAVAEDGLVIAETKAEASALDRAAPGHDGPEEASGRRYSTSERFSAAARSVGSGSR